MQDEHATTIQNRVEALCAAADAETPQNSTTAEGVEPSLAPEWYVRVTSPFRMAGVRSYLQRALICSVLTLRPWGGASSLLCDDDDEESRRRRTVTVHSSLVLAYVVRGVRYPTLRAFLDSCELAQQVTTALPSLMLLCSSLSSVRLSGGLVPCRWRLWRGTSSHVLVRRRRASPPSTCRAPPTKRTRMRCTSWRGRNTRGRIARPWEVILTISTAWTSARFRTTGASNPCPAAPGPW